MRVWVTAATGLFASTLAFGAKVELVEGVRCSDIERLRMDTAESMRAGLILIGCGVTTVDSDQGEVDGAARLPVLPIDLGKYRRRNVDTISGDEVFPHVTQSESMIWHHGETIVVNYNDSTTSNSTPPRNYSGVSVSLDDGHTFTRLLPAPFATGHYTNYGDPIVVFNEARQTWVAGDLATGCGGTGIGLWTSPDGVNWAPGACAHTGRNDDRESMSVDNNPASATFGRMYISWNDYDKNRQLFITYSDDGDNWSHPIVVDSHFIRNVQLTVPPDGDSTVFLAGMDEMGGGTMRQNLIYRSTDGGNTWTVVYRGDPFFAAGAPGCNYFWRIAPIWRYMGWGQPAAGPNGTIHYAYGGRGRNLLPDGSWDQGDIYYIRSSDNGDTWSDPIVLNSDQALGGTREQWQPSVSVSEWGSVFVSWYDRRNTTDGQDYEYRGILSRNNGLTWLDDVPVSDIIIPQPKQPDGQMQSCYAGDYNYQTASAFAHFVTWTDGRKLVETKPQQDVEFEMVYDFGLPKWPPFPP